MALQVFDSANALITIYRIGSTPKAGEFCQLGTLGFIEGRDSQDPDSYVFELNNRFIHTHVPMISLDTFEDLEQLYPPELRQRIREIFDRGPRKYRPKAIAYLREIAEDSEFTVSQILQMPSIHN